MLRQNTGNNNSYNTNNRKTIILFILE